MGREDDILRKGKGGEVMKTKWLAWLAWLALGLAFGLAWLAFGLAWLALLSGLAWLEWLALLASLASLAWLALGLALLAFLAEDNEKPEPKENEGKS
jgi:fatty acid desaturase